MDNPDASPAVPEGAPVDWRALLGHKEVVQAAELTDAAFDRFKGHRHEFIAVLEGDRAIGICARREIGMLLGGRYGYALYARKPVRAHMAPSALCISEDMSAETVLTKVFTRKAETFYDDVVLVDDDGAFVGLIPVHALVRLQTSLREAHVRQIDIQRDEIAGKNAQMEADLALARELQLALLPRLFPAFPPTPRAAAASLRFTHLYLPSTALGGDFFHVMPLDESHAGVFICDVMGHGVRAALVTAMIRVLVQKACAVAVDPALALARVNQGLMEIIPQDAGVMFVTAAYAIFDVERRIVQYASAGHPPPLHLHRGTGRAEPLPISRGDFNPALGLFPTATFHLYERALAEGDMVLFLTDGLFEVEDAAGEQIGAEGLAACVESCAQIPFAEFVPGIVAAVQSVAANGFDDDVCLLAALLGPSVTN